MSGLWFLFTARPQEVWTKAWGQAHSISSLRSPAPFVMLDDDRVGIGPMMDRAFETFPGLDFYGWLADDTFPITKDWDETIADAAGSMNLAYAEDGGYLSPGGGPKDGTELSSGLCWGGDLVRATGSWSLGFHSAWIDMAWLDLLRPLGLLRYVPEVTVRHDNWRTGRRERDDLDDRALERVHHDQQDFFRWQEEEAPRLRQQIEGALACVS